MKRLLDALIAFVAMLVLSPLILTIAVLVRWRLGPPVFFRQLRPGLLGRPFQLVKFRTMLNDHDEHGNLRPDGDRLTPFGRFLRSTSLDELPELWNVMKGDMSLVGPRPLLTDYLPLYSPEQARRHEVRPGLTGWAQINGRNALTWDDKLALDVWYVDHRTFWLDTKILIMTVRTVLASEGISAAGDATMPRFTGSARRLPDGD